MNERTNAIRRALSDPYKVCARLGLTKGARRQHGGLLVCCPAHGDRTPSCSVTRGPDGTLRIKCFGCDLAGDVFHLIAASLKLSLRRFSEVVDAGGELAGIPRDADSWHGKTAPIDFPDLDDPAPPRDYPPQQEVANAWQTAVECDCVESAQSMLQARGLAPEVALARALLGGAVLPRWAAYQGRDWCATGHRVLVPMYDHVGDMRSVRAWQCLPGYDGPKRLPPAGYRATGLVMANAWALEMLHAAASPVGLLIVEGEPDYLTACQAHPGVAVIGVVNGSWSTELAERVPMGSEVVVRTHRDKAGEKYASEIVKSLRSRAVIRRVA